MKILNLYGGIGGNRIDIVITTDILYNQFMKKWSRKYTKCIKCKRSDRKHKGHGLCENCFDKKRYKENPKVKEYRDKYRKNNRAKIRESQRRYHRRIKEELFNLLGNKCVKCGFADKRALQIDHINGGGCKELKLYSSKDYRRVVLKSLKNKENKYQLLCANCNWIKRDTNNELYKQPRKI